MAMEKTKRVVKVKKLVRDKKLALSKKLEKVAPLGLAGECLDKPHNN